MAKKNMDDLLRRMSAAQKTSELEVGNKAYETVFQAEVITSFALNDKRRKVMRNKRAHLPASSYEWYNK